MFSYKVIIIVFGLLFLFTFEHAQGHKGIKHGSEHKSSDTIQIRSEDTVVNINDMEVRLNERSEKKAI